ncbi:MAG: molybdopterin-dependent oxidoreductase [Oscillospiraceae bacterium]|nr:molybdopterin-dependent oxidoreductase [Oscillospiraceae bacterium]
MALRRIIMIVNGVERAFTFNPERDTLAEVLRRYGLTGTKVGCGTGQCGSCSVILNGKVVRSCRKYMRDLNRFDVVETIEGLGTANHLHPLQQAWITYGGVQCGFCTPGFIVSAKALLDENLTPTREEVRAWFQKHRNICRCTGYKPLVDAVMAAAAVMRGEKTMEDITFHTEGKEGFYGSKLPRPAALAKVMGLADYGDDIKHKMPPGTLHVAVVQPRITSHAKILRIHTEEAEEMPGVVKVVTAKDVKGTNRMNTPVAHPRSKANGLERPIFADEKIYRYGDLVAAVVATDEETARAAAKKVTVELEPLPEYLNYLDAVMPDALSIHEEGGNIYMVQPLHKGEEAAEVINRSYCSVGGSFHSSREPHLSLEGQTLQAYWDEEGNLTLQCKTQAIGFNRGAMGPAIGLPPEKIRLIENPTGASFGWAVCAANYAFLAVCLMAVNQPLTITMSYEETQHFVGKRTPSYSNARLACDETGRLTALEFDIGIDHGPYTEIADALAQKVCRFMGFPYQIPNITGLSRIAHTNHNFGTSYRGFGSPQAYTTSESLMDMLARKMGMDPFEFRYLNVARPGDLNPNGYPYKDYPMVELMDKARPIYQEWTKHAEETSTPERKRGVGVSCGGFNVTLGFDRSQVALELNQDGTFTQYNTWEDQGQGGDIGALTLTHEALRPMKVPLEKIRLVMNDSHLCPDSGIAAGSRSHYMGGRATIDAANQLMDAMRKPDGTYRTYDEMVAEGIPTKYTGSFDTAATYVPIDPNSGHGDPTPEYNYGVFLSEVEVEIATGKTTVLRMLTVGDVGVIGNRLAVEGQAYGGMSHTVGFALTEDYDDLKRHGSLAACGIPTIQEVPDDMQLIFQENRRTEGPFGSCGCSELFQSGGHMSIINGIEQAAGVRIDSLPAKPEQVLTALEGKASGADQTQEPYYLGQDFYDTLDELRDNPV